jgi:ribosomal protein S18 acetylase RimI-like enzyme
MAVTVRNFEEKDAPRIAEIMYESFKSVFKERWGSENKDNGDCWKEHVKKSNPEKIQVVFVAEDEGKVIGFLHVSADVKWGLGILHCIGVDPNCFARGVGKAMAAEAERLWQEKRMRKVYTCTSHINQRALAFYKSLGFEEEGLLKSHFFEGIDEIQLAKFYTYND